VLVRIVGKRDPYTLLVRMQVKADTIGISIEAPQKLKLKLPYDPTILP
jgi:hypothetical protein